MLGFNRRDVTTAVNLFRMDLRDRHLGSSLGLTWAVLQPLLTLAVYTTVFGFIFKAKMPGAETTLAYSIWMISGLGPWLATSEAILSGSNSIWSHENMVKNIPMKTEILTFTSSLTGMVPLAITLPFLLVLMFFDGNYPTWHTLYLLPAVILHVMFIFGLTLFLAPLVVFVRDITHALPSLLMIMMFMTPIFYAIEMMPRPIAAVSHVNPFYIIIQGYRLPLIYHEIPPFWGTLYLLVLSVAMMVVGLGVFRRVKPYFNTAL